MKCQSFLIRSLDAAGGIALAIAVVALTGTLTVESASGAASGEQLFKENCAACHAGGGNIVNPKKPLKGSAPLASEDAFKKYLLKPSGTMQPFPSIANDSASLKALYVYCKALK